MSIIQEVRNSFTKGSIITKLIYLNVALFVIIHLIEVLSYLIGFQLELISYFALPAELNLLLTKFWTCISYMFMHADIIHLLFNVLWLYWMGELFLRYFNAKQFFSVYFLSGLLGALFFILLYNISPLLSEQLSVAQLLGASAAVLGIVAAVATYAPNHPIRLFFIGEIKLKYLALISLLVYALGLSGTNAGGQIAHIGGMCFGFLFVVFLRRGIDITLPLCSFIFWLEKVFDFKPKIKLSYRNHNRASFSNSSVPKNPIDDILEKVRLSGYDSLTREEKQSLFKMKNQN
ncbi:MAG: rhomboid family intramembrane serine protease [Mangrovibacterium sp.]